MDFIFLFLVLLHCTYNFGAIIWHRNVYTVNNFQEQAASQRLLPEATQVSITFNTTVSNLTVASDYTYQIHLDVKKNISGRMAVGQI